MGQEPIFLAQLDPKEYLSQFYKGGTIPTDDSNTALAVIQRYADLLTARGITPQVSVAGLVGKSDHEIEEQYKVAREQEYVKDHWIKDQIIQDALEYLKKLDGDNNADVVIEDDPTYLEWAAWRGLLAFNSLQGALSQWRGFQIDEDMCPVRTALGGRPDIVMSYPDFLLVTEVTMMSVTSRGRGG